MGFRPECAFIDISGVRIGIVRRENAVLIERNKRGIW